MTRAPRPEDLLCDPASSGWILQALRSALHRDPIDAANDAALLAQVLDAHAADVLAAALAGQQEPGR